MRFDKKLVVIIRDNLLTWQKLNVTAFLMSSIGGTQNIIGQPYVDGNQVSYLPMSQQPIMIYLASGEELNKEVKMITYTGGLFNTHNDEDDRSKVEEYPTDKLNLVGIDMFEKKNHVSKLIKGLKLHE